MIQLLQGQLQRRVLGGLSSSLNHQRRHDTYLQGGRNTHCLLLQEVAVVVVVATTFDLSWMVWEVQLQDDQSKLHYSPLDQDDV